MSFKQLVTTLEAEIEKSYIEGVTLNEAENLAGQFLHAQMKVSEELKKSDLDSRTRKSGVKAIRAAIYLEIVQKSDKKPTEAGITSMIDVDDIVKAEQNALDTAEVERDDLKRYYDIFTNAHIYFRGIAKGKFE
jgi:hypothetical protein